MESLLGQFYTRIKGSQEDIASEGLTYVLQRSKSARQAINNLIQQSTELIFDDINYSTQSIGEKLERPDVSGTDKDGNEVIIMEAKFWAALTKNQPVEYLNRMGGDTVLIFIVPTMRVRPVFDELRTRIEKAGMKFASDNHNHTFALDNNKKLIVKTWQEILEVVRQSLIKANEPALLSDINQVIGLCETIDNNSFQPYQNEDFAPCMAKKVNSFYDLIDQIVDELKKQDKANTTNLRSASQKYTYTRYFKIGSLGLSLNVRFDLWERIADTPFWLSIRDDTTDGANWKQTANFRKEIRNVASYNAIIPYESNSKELFLPLFPLLEQTEDLVVNDLASRIIKLTEELMKNVTE
ncbi:MAG: hypothetical protein EZS26_001932 [Candidatus Ordinivivax streblomastigis]|uniref:Uncharacterized protein n=1 Tax=Candidatus Ordinivivax streblomastigis TaxID=2540710 RepID=A0A5M8P0I2_9BACT|nr:MAG: hypothetical protein EZS26_001932 [Candidatus Ordinivivax streblomastigis]